VDKNETDCYNLWTQMLRLVVICVQTCTRLLSVDTNVTDFYNL